MAGETIALAGLSEGLLKSVGPVDKRFLGQTLAQVVSEAVCEAEAAAIADALRYRRFDLERAAETLAISTQELREKMQRYALNVIIAPPPDADQGPVVGTGDQIQDIGSTP